MIITCSHCAARLHLEDAKIPARPFNVRCPKCQQTINAQPPAAANDAGALALDEVPTPVCSQVENAASAPTFAPDSSTANFDESASAPSMEKNDLARLLAALLQQNVEPNHLKSGERGTWKRRVLVCTQPAHHHAMTNVLAKSQYEMLIAADMTQGIELMREDRIDIVILDPEFDQTEQGAAFINREINSLRPEMRRRVLFVHLSPAVRTADPHAAFINHANLVVNPADIADLSRVLDRTIHEFNHLYRDFNKALNISEL